MPSSVGNIRIDIKKTKINIDDKSLKFSQIFSLTTHKTWYVYQSFHKHVKPIIRLFFYGFNGCYTHKSK